MKIFQQARGGWINDTHEHVWLPSRTASGAGCRSSQLMLQPRARLMPSVSYLRSLTHWPASGVTARLLPPPEIWPRVNVLYSLRSNCSDICILKKILHPWRNRLLPLGIPPRPQPPTIARRQQFFILKYYNCDWQSAKKAYWVHWVLVSVGTSVVCMSSPTLANIQWQLHDFGFSERSCAFEVRFHSSQLILLLRRMPIWLCVQHEVRQRASVFPFLWMIKWIASSRTNCPRALSLLQFIPPVLAVWPGHCRIQERLKKVAYTLLNMGWPISTLSEMI